MSQKRLVIDLSASVIPDEGAFWSAIAEPCGLPPWFGRNLAAWSDTLFGGQISDVVDQHDEIVIRVRPEGLFASGQDRGRLLREVTEQTGKALIEVVE